MRPLLCAVAAAVVLALPASASAATPWIGPQAVSTAQQPGLLPGMLPFSFDGGVTAVNGAGRAAEAWLATGAGGTGGALLVARRAPDGTWSTPEDLGSFNSYSVAIAMDAAGDATVVFGTGSGANAKIVSVTSVAGAAFGAPVTIASDIMPQDPSIDVAMNAAGETVMVYTSADAKTPTYAATAATPGGPWTPPVNVSGAADVTDSDGAQVAINAAGKAEATFLVATASSATGTQTRGASRLAGAAWQAAAAQNFGDASRTATPQPVVDGAGRVSVLFRSGSKVQIGTQVADVTVAPGVEQTVPTSVCSTTSGAQDLGGVIAVDSADTRTIAFPCAGAVYAASRGAVDSFTGATPTNVASSTRDPSLGLDVAPDGKALLVAAKTDGKLRGYRRAAGSATFGPAEALLEPDPSTDVLLHGLGITDAGDGIVVLGRGRSGENVTDEISSLLDLSPPTGGIDGPTTGAPGELLTFRSTIADSFGGLVGDPAWSSSDGGSGSGPTFDRTYTAPGTYKVTLTQTDIAGHSRTASTQVTVAVPPPAAPAGPATPGGGTPVTPPVTPPAVPARTCKVPKLKGKTLSAAKKALKKAGCRTGKVKRPKVKRGRRKPKLVVSKQSAAAKRVVPAGTKVTLTLKAKKRKRR